MLIKRIFFLICIAGIFAGNANGRVAPDSVTTILMRVETGLQFSLVRFNIKPGQKVKLIFENTDDMDHNMVITKPGAREEVVMAALKLGEQGPSVGYIPKSYKILWSIPVTAPHQEKSITFTAPKESGIYPYVCTYPGHGFVMYGAMYINTSGTMPELATDLNIPPNRRGVQMSEGEKNDDMHAGHHMPAVPKPLHPYKPVAPYLYRVFIEGASPAAIAVSLPDSLSYCWDAGTCRLRFAWKGGFLDNSDLWKGKGNALAKVTGKIFFRENAFPFRLSAEDKLPVTSYKGYKLINHYPEFHYTIDGLDVYEIVKPQAGTNGLVRTFRIPAAQGPIWFITNTYDGVTYQSSAGQWVDRNLKLTAVQARNFSISMTAKGGTAL